MRCFFLLVLAALVCSGCATPRVVLYPDQHLKSQPKEVVQKDIDDCQALAKEYVKAHKGQIVARHIGAGAFFGAFLGVIAGAFTGDYARAVTEGVAMGAATGLAQGALDANGPDAVQRRYVEYCLMEKDYKPMGWK